MNAEPAALVDQLFISELSDNGVLRVTLDDSGRRNAL